MRRVEEMAVVARRPGRKIAAATAFGLALFAFGFAVGGRVEGFLPPAPPEPSADVALVGPPARARAGFSVAATVEAGANEKLRRTVKTLRDRVGVLQEELRFYQRLVSPSESQDGLRIERWSVARAEDARQFAFSLLLAQIVERHEWIEGALQVELVGERDGAVETLPLQDVAVSAAPPEAFGFRYFQGFSGRLKLPDDFAPRRVSVTATLADAGEAPVRRDFEWLVEED